MAPRARTAPKKKCKSPKEEFSESSHEWVVTRMSGYRPDGFHAPTAPHREILHTVPDEPNVYDSVVKLVEDAVQEGMCGMSWEEIEQRCDYDIIEETSEKFEVRCDYHDGGEYVHVFMERKRIPKSQASSQPLAPSKTGKTKTSSVKKQEWVVVSETGYHSDGFHAPESPRREEVARVPAGPSSRKELKQVVRSAVQEGMCGLEWDELQEICNYRVEEDTSNRYNVFCDHPDGNEYVRVTADLKKCHGQRSAASPPGVSATRLIGKSKKIAEKKRKASSLLPTLL